MWLSDLVLYSQRWTTWKTLIFLELNLATAMSGDSFSDLSKYSN